MTNLSGCLSHIHQLLHYTGSVMVSSATRKLAIVQVTSNAMQVPVFERWGMSIRRRLAGLAAAASQAVLARSLTHQELLRTSAERRRELDAAVARCDAMAADSTEMRQQLQVATATIGDLRRTEARYIAMATDCAEMRRQLDVATSTITHLRRMEERYDAMAVDCAEMRRQMDAATSTITHLKGMEARCEALAAVDSHARRGVQAFVDELQRKLFEVRETTPQSRSAAVLVLGDQPVEDALATLVNLSEPLHGARPFQYVLPFLAASAPFPLPWPEWMASLRIVDVGSQQLDFENDVFAPLPSVAPVEAIGFDPFAVPTDAQNGWVDVRLPDGGSIRTYPHVLADGGMVTFHINRFDATSSILPTNHELTRPFGLLDLALKTLDTQKLQSRRLDDVLADTGAVDLLKVDVQGATHNVLDHGRALLGRTLVCHVEAEFAPVYLGERLFADIDTLLREAGFGFVDFFSLGRQRYAGFDGSRARAFHRGRTLWADCIYLRGLDTPEELTPDELFRQALIMHVCYNKQDLAAELLGRSDTLTGGALRDAYVSSLVIEKTR
jgi:FkbM family methyltransferase